MSRNFQAEFRKKCQKIMGEETQAIEHQQTKESRWYNIHKRSLPVDSTFDKIVIFNIESKKAAEKLIENCTDKYGNKLFAPKIYYNNSHDTKTIIYYDIIPVDAKPEERNIFSNYGISVTKHF